MIVKFDSLNRLEVPQIYLCNPGCVYNGNGTLSNTIGCLYDTSDEELILNFNTTSELNFRINLIHRENPDEDIYVSKLYKLVQNRRLIFVEDVGFFVIREVIDGYDNGVYCKDVRADSCEFELSNKLVPFIKEGTYPFRDLLETIMRTVPLWKIGDVNENIAKLYRTFDEVSTDKNVLSFFLEDMQDAFECIFEFDTVNRIVSVSDQNAFVKQSRIHLTKDDVINKINITESSDDIYTAISVEGADGLSMSPVNPLGTNVIYDFTYYLGWMSTPLSAKVSEWQKLVSDSVTDYYNLNLDYYYNLESVSNCEAEIERLKKQFDMYDKCQDDIVANGSHLSVEGYNEIIKKNGGTPIGVQNEIADTVNVISMLIADVEEKLSSEENKLITLIDTQSRIAEQIDRIRDSVNISKYFTHNEYEELSNYIFEGEYIDEYIAVTDSMDAKEDIDQRKLLYDRAVSRLSRISEPKQEFTIDVENFLFEREFSEFSNELKTGYLINIELKPDDIAALFLSNITVNYDDKKLTLTFGNRFNRFDPQAMFNNILGDIKKSANSINYIKEILYPVKNGEFSALREAIESSGVLTKDLALSASNQEFVIDDTGIMGRRLLSNGEFDSKQIKITNNTIAFTDDAWSTANTALGNYLFKNPFTGLIESKYGLIADTIVGNIVLSEQVGIYNADTSVTLDNGGLVLTANYTDKSKPVDPEFFCVQKKHLNNDGNETYTKLMYIDTDGNLVINGSIRINAVASEDVDPNTLNGLLNDAVIKANKYTNKEIDDSEELINGRMDELKDGIDEEFRLLKLADIDMVDAHNDFVSNVNNNFVHTADLGQYMYFNENGLIIGANGGADHNGNSVPASPFKTVIDNRGIWFKEDGKIISYVANNLLYIPDAVIEKTLAFGLSQYGHFYFAPHVDDEGNPTDGGVSLMWSNNAIKKV